MPIEPFRIRVPAAVLHDLRRRLRLTRWPDAAGGVPWDEGTDLDYLRGLAEYWADGFDWRAQESRLNRLPQFRADLGGRMIHFLHQRGAGPDPLPLVITHGWPGSFVELAELIPRLANPARFGGDPTDSFDVVIPSLPGYGFSDPPPSPGLHPGEIARLWLQLMEQLGYRRFGAQGGDWGASVATRLALLAPERVAGIHLNYIPGSYRPCLESGAPLSPAEKRFLAEREAWYEEEGGYAHLQRTRPQTVAYGLTDSPVGLAAWIVEKLRAWSDCDGEVERRFSRDEILTNVMLYWVTGSIGPSMRLYGATGRHPLHFGPGERVRVPVGVAVLPREAPSPPREWVERAYEVTRWTSLPRGGHFAAWEEPDELAADVREFFRGMR